MWGSPSAVVWWEGTDLVQYYVVSTLSGKIGLLAISPRTLICCLWLSGLGVGQPLCGGVVGGDGLGPVLRGLHALWQDCPPCYYHPVH